MSGPADAAGGDYGLSPLPAVRFTREEWNALHVILSHYLITRWTPPGQPEAEYVPFARQLRNEITALCALRDVARAVPPQEPA